VNDTVSLYFPSRTTSDLVEGVNLVIVVNESTLILVLVPVAFPYFSFNFEKIVPTQVGAGLEKSRE
jgi:hypothetical protein